MAALAVALLATACRSTPVHPKVPVTTASASASQAPTAKPTLAPAQPLKGAPGAVALAGTVRIDAAYLLSESGGRLLSEGGAGAVAVANTGLIANNGGNLAATSAQLAQIPLISDNGLGLVSDNGLGIITENGAGLVSDNGLGIITENGAGLISEKGSGLIANNGSALTSKSKFGLLSAGLAPGTQAPAAGMLVMAIDMSTGAPVSVGVDAAGKPVYGAFTNASGGYQLFLPPTVAGNVRLAAVAPHATDPRLRYNLVLKGGATDGLLDEDTAVATELLRTLMAGKLADAAGQANTNVGFTVGGGTLPAPIAAVFANLVDGLRQDGVAAGSGRLTAAGRQRLGLILSDFFIAHVTLSELTSTGAKGTTTEPVLAALTDIFHQLSQGAAARLAADPAYFATRPYLVEANRKHAAAGEPTTAIKRPSDLSAFVVREYLGTLDAETQRRARLVLADVGLAPDQYARLNNAANGVFIALGALLVTDDATQAAVHALGRSTITNLLAHPPTAPAPGGPAPVPVAAAEPGAIVTTLAGDGTPGSTDGPVAAARFNSPTALALASDGTLYVGESGSGRIRRIGTDGMVSTLAGDGAGDQVGPGAQARFGAISSLALDGKGGLYVGDYLDPNIKRVDLDDPTHPVTLVAGGTVAGFADEPGAGARFGRAAYIGCDGHGGLAVSDGPNNRIRFVALDDPAHPVKTLFGTDSNIPGWGPVATATIGAAGPLTYDAQGQLWVFDNVLLDRLTTAGLLEPVAGLLEQVKDDFWLDAGFQGPGQFAVEADGGAIVLDRYGQRLRRISPLGDVSTFAGGGPTGENLGSFADGTGDAARFNTPAGLALAPDGTVYVADTLNHRIRKVTRKK